MMCFPSMLEEAAKQAGIKVPENSDDFNSKDYPHFQIYCNLQLGVPITWGNHWENAKIIAAIPNDKIMLITRNEINDLGFVP